MPAQTTTQRIWIRGQGDTAPPIKANFVDEDGDPMDLVGFGIEVTIDIAHHSRDHFYAPYPRIVGDRFCSHTAGVMGQVEYNPAPGDLNAPGLYDIQFNILYPDGSVQTLPEPPLRLKVVPRVGGP